MNTTDLTLLFVLAYLILGTLGIALVFGWALRRVGHTKPPPEAALGSRAGCTDTHAYGNRAKRQSRAR